MADIELFAVTAAGAQPVPVPAGAASVHELFDGLPLGVYSCLRTYGHNRFLHLDDHIDRTERSIRLAGSEFEIDRPALRRALHEVCTAYPQADAIVRFDVLTEPATQLGVQSRMLVALSPFQPVPAEFLREGVGVELARELHREQPLVKFSNFVIERRPFPLSSRECYEHLLLGLDECILEGSSSNFYGVDGSALRTAGAGVLEGVSRKIIFKLAPALGLTVSDRAVALDEVAQLDGAFLTSSTRGVVPVVNVAGTDVGNGRPPAAVRELLAAYADYGARNAETAV